MSVIADHLWQSTWFAAAAWLLAQSVRNDSARVRYWVWLAASFKFLVPFAALSWLGNQFVIQLQDRPSLLLAAPPVPSLIPGEIILVRSVSDGLKLTLLVVWALGSLLVARRWILECLECRTQLKKSTPCDFGSWLQVRASDHVAEPVLVGIFDPVVLMPRYAIDSLTAAQIDAVLAHEKWHVRRQDNLLACVHTWVQIFFWFHPMVWWIGAKLVREREHACDEGAIRDGCDPVTYAESLIQVSALSVASRHVCMARAAGGDLTARVRAIVSPQPPSRATLIGRGVLLVALIGCVALQVGFGARIIVASDLDIAAGARSIRLSDQTTEPMTVLHEDFVYARNVTLRELISEVYAVTGRGIRSDKRALDYPRYDIELRASQKGAADHEHLVADLLKQQFNIELVTQTGF